MGDKWYNKQIKLGNLLQGLAIASAMKSLGGRLLSLWRLEKHKGQRTTPPPMGAQRRDTFLPGDHYITINNKGTHTIGEVREYGEVTKVAGKIVYKAPYIVNTIGEIIPLDNVQYSVYRVVDLTAIKCML